MQCIGIHHDWTEYTSDFLKNAFGANIFLADPNFYPQLDVLHLDKLSWCWQQLWSEFSTTSANKEVIDVIYVTEMTQWNRYPIILMTARF